MIRKCTWLLVVLFLMPTIVSGLWAYGAGWPTSFRDANWNSSRIAPSPRKSREAIIQVYAARAGQWKGAFGVHTWIVLKPKNSNRFERYDVVGWGLPVRRNKHSADAHWFGNKPYVVRDIRGSLAERTIPKIRKTIARYPNNKRGDYTVWPGPNSNTFIAWVARQFPELSIEMPPTAVGKDFIGPTFAVTHTPSATGWQFSVAGVFGMALAWKEGFEIHLLGATFGIDPQELAIKVPSLGKLALLPSR